MNQALQSDETLLFTYGTLQPGASYGHLLGPVIATMAARVQGVLFALPEGYPALVLGGLPGFSDGEVHGTLVTTRLTDTAWRRLDEYEDCPGDGVGGLYRRARHTVQCEDGKTQHAWIYTWNPARLEALIARGKWLRSGRFTE